MLPVPNPRSKRTARLVMAAIGDMQKSHRSRISLQTITEHIANEYDIPAKDFKKYVPTCLGRGVAFGAIAKKHGSYTIGEAMAKGFMADWRRVRNRDEIRNLARKRKLKKKH